MISCAVMKTRTAALNRSTSKSPSAVLNFIKLSDARLQAVLSRKRYSLHGLVEFCRSVPLHVCHLWMVESNCMPGSPQMYVPSAIFRSSVRASLRPHGLPPPLNFSRVDLKEERSVPVPLPYLKSIASLVANRMMSSIVSPTLWMKQALPCGYSYCDGARSALPVSRL